MTERNRFPFRMYAVQGKGRLVNSTVHEKSMEIIEVLRDEPVISSLISSEKMAVLNIYIDEDIQAWRSYMPIYPEQWYNGFDPDFVIRGEELYNIRAIPSLYLLDKEKNVLMKDVPENVLFNYLVNVNQ